MGCARAGEGAGRRKGKQDSAKYWVTQRDCGRGCWRKGSVAKQQVADLNGQGSVTSASNKERQVWWVGGTMHANDDGERDTHETVISLNMTQRAGGGSEPLDMLDAQCGTTDAKTGKWETRDQAGQPGSSSPLFPAATVGKAPAARNAFAGLGQWIEKESYLTALPWFGGRHDGQNADPFC